MLVESYPITSYMCLRSSFQAVAFLNQLIYLTKEDVGITEYDFLSTLWEALDKIEAIEVMNGNLR